MKILFISNITNKITNFAIPSICASEKLNIEFHHAANWSNVSEKLINEQEEQYGIKIHQIDFERNPFKLKNYNAYKQLIKLMKENNFDIVHCNTPIGGILGRICAKQMKVPKVIYTAHGFHFYEGAPKINNIIYKSVERYLSKLTNCIITITKEDYKNALEFKKVNKDLNVFYVPGVGINRDEIINVRPNRKAICKELGISEDSFFIISAGELNKNKNQKIVIEAISNIDKNENIHYLVCGLGANENGLKKLAFEKGLKDNIHFLGYRNDIVKLMKSCDVFVMSSYREGLSRAIMEAMTSGLPIIASNIRGNVDLVNENNGGWLCTLDNSDEFKVAIEKSMNKDLQEKMGNYNINYSEKFDVTNIEKKIYSIYKMYVNNKRKR